MKQITASMAGTVLNILVNIGDDVTPGRVVVMLESMKMEIPIETIEAGKVSEIKVSTGDFVNEGDILVTIE